MKLPSNNGTIPRDRKFFFNGDTVVQLLGGFSSVKVLYTLEGIQSFFWQEDIP
jgi:hypothetical protein